MQARAVPAGPTRAVTSAIEAYCALGGLPAAARGRLGLGGCSSLRRRWSPAPLSSLDTRLEGCHQILDAAAAHRLRRRLDGRGAPFDQPGQPVAILVAESLGFEGSGQIFDEDRGHIALMADQSCRR